MRGEQTSAAASPAKLLRRLNSMPNSASSMASTATSQRMCGPSPSASAGNSREALRGSELRSLREGTAYSHADRVREREPASAAEVLFGQRVASLRAVLPQISGELLQLNER